MKKDVFSILIISAVNAVFIVDPDRPLSLRNSKGISSALALWWHTSPLLTGGAFLLFYATAAAISLTGAVVLALIDGKVLAVLFVRTRRIERFASQTRVIAIRWRPVQTSVSQKPLIFHRIPAYLKELAYVSLSVDNRHAVTTCGIRDERC